MTTERHPVPEEWNQTRRPLPAWAMVLERFEANARLAPERPALVAGEETLSYGELDRRAGQLAGFLGGLGVGAESCVAVCVEPSVEMVLAQLGVMKAHAAWVALDPTHAALAGPAAASDVVVSSIVDGRRRVGGLEGVLGCFVSPVLLRLGRGGQPSFRELVGRARIELFTVMAVPELPLLPFVFPRFNDHFRVVFNFVGSEAPLQWPGFEVGPLPWQDHRRLFVSDTFFLDLYFQFSETPGHGLSGLLRFNSALWWEQAARALLAALGELLEAGARDPDVPLGHRPPPPGKG